MKFSKESYDYLENGIREYLDSILTEYPDKYKNYHQIWEDIENSFKNGNNEINVKSSTKFYILHSAYEKNFLDYKRFWDYKDSHIETALNKVFRTLFKKYY